MIDLDAEDEQLHHDLRFRANPFKYAYHKWICKKSRQQRYKVTDEQIAHYDDRRMIDARFWLYLGFLSNVMF